LSCQRVILLRTGADIESFFEKLLASLRSNGYSLSKLGDHRIKLLNSTTALYGTIANSSEIRRHGDAAVRFTYLLRRNDVGWRIHEIIATDLDKLINSD
jgi:hypothetical protein